MSSPEHKEKIWNLIKDIRIGMLVSHDGKDDLHARPMALVQDEYDGTIWFFTRAHAEKVDEIQYDRTVCITFCDAGDDVHVSLTGTAKLSRDRTLINKFWNPWADAWFKGGKDDPEVALLEIKIHKGEHWKGDNKFIELFEVAKANLFDDQTPDLGENRKFG
jgi:general stress protein 26